MKQPHFFLVYTNSQKLKADQKKFLLGIVINGCGQSGSWIEFECISRMNKWN